MAWKGSSLTLGIFFVLCHQVTSANIPDQPHVVTTAWREVPHKINKTAGGYEIEVIQADDHGASTTVGWQTKVIIACTFIAAAEIVIILIILTYWQQIRWNIFKLYCPCCRRRRGRRRVPRTADHLLSNLPSSGPRDRGSRSIFSQDYLVCDEVVWEPIFPKEDASSVQGDPASVVLSVGTGIAKADEMMMDVENCSKLQAKSEVIVTANGVDPKPSLSGIRYPSVRYNSPDPCDSSSEDENAHCSQTLVVDVHPVPL